MPRPYARRSKIKIEWALSASLTGDFRFDLTQSAGAVLRGDGPELLTIRVAAVYFVETTRRVAGPADDGSAG